MITIKCTKCGIDKPENNFAMRADHPVRYRQCRDCINSRARTWRVNNPDKARASTRRYYNKNKSDPKWMRELRERIYKNRSENPETYSAIAARYIENNKDKVRERNKFYDSLPEERARRKLKYQIKIGNIIRPKKCSKCDKVCKPEGHHHDYSKPLDVTWLCKKCHSQEHKKY